MACESVGVYLEGKRGLRSGGFILCNFFIVHMPSDPEKFFRINFSFYCERETLVSECSLSPARQKKSALLVVEGRGE